MSKLYFSIIGQYDDKLVQNVFMLSSEYENYMIISNDSANIEIWKKNIKASHGKDIDSLVLDSSVYMPCVEFFLGEMECFKNKTLLNVDIKSFDVFEQVSISCILDDVFLDDGMTIERSSLSSIDSIIRNEIDSLNGIYQNIFDIIHDIFVGKSEASLTENINNISLFTDFSSLSLSEVKKKFFKLSNLKESNYSYVNDFIRNVRRYFNYSFLTIPQSPVNISSLSATNKYCQDGFPLVFKVISVIHYYSAALCEMKKDYSLSFLHMVRAVECYIDGLLLMNNNASYTASNEYAVNGKLRKGATYKLSLASQSNNNGQMLQQACYKNVLKYMEMRNKFFLTHGDIRVCENIISDFSSNVSDLISYIENHTMQINFRWVKAYSDLSSLINISKKDFIMKSLLEKYHIN
ncbi:hypothetical protein [Providencia sp. PROV150]|uniref:hypothetical protein n=1 Tax=Providencia sp. PROV150 TaxID=2949860 RepID=UPI00234A607D|nr:hypothetical protein [Providencia sp. PROV150]